jgi:hypothetical protein
MKSQPSEPSEADKECEILLKQFRAYLHLAITAKQTGQKKQLEALPGSNFLSYCRLLAEQPEYTLAQELSRPVEAVLDQISRVVNICEGTLRRQDEKSVARQASSKRILAEIDRALAVVVGNHLNWISRRAAVTEYSDLLSNVLYHMAIGHGTDAANLTRRFQKLNPDDGGYTDMFVWDVYQRVEALDKLADEFPDYIRPTARRMHAWPMLVHRHTNNRRRFKQLADRLELGADYPTDASEGARFRPDTPLVRYLDPLIYRLNVTCQETRDIQFKSIQDEQWFLYMTWWTRQEDCPGEDVLAVIHAARLLPPLTKATAVQWAEKAIVPLILATDARDWKNCDESALKKIAGQKGVKSRATFKSRLLAAVAATLRRLARPA